jgi:hypothetical protein
VIECSLERFSELVLDGIFSKNVGVKILHLKDTSENVNRLVKILSSDSIPPGLKINVGSSASANKHL